MGKIFNPAVDFGAEIIIIIFFITFLFLVSKALSNIKIGHRVIRVPKVMSVLITAFILGLISKAIWHDADGNSLFKFTIGSQLSMISLLALMISFGTSINIRQIKSFGIWVLLLGTVPYLVEAFGVTLLLSFTTKLKWFEAMVCGSMISVCSIGISSPRLMQNVIKGYEKETSLNETLSLSMALENISELIMMVITLVLYQFGVQNKMSATGISEAVFLVVPLLVISGVVLGILMALIGIYVFIPVSKKIYPTYKISTDGKNGLELETANKLNALSEKKQTIVSWVLMFLGITFIYLVIQFTIGLGFVTFIVAIVAGLVMALKGTNDKELSVITKKHSKMFGTFYGTLGCIFVWGFGGFIIDPTQFQGNDWSASALPNIIYIILFTIVALGLRFISIVLLMRYNKGYTMKQKLYAFTTFFIQGTGGVNNGAVVLTILGLPVIKSYQDSQLIIQSIFLGWGAFMLFFTVIIGDTLLVYLRDKFIFKWKGVSESEFKNLVNIETKNSSSEEREELSSLVKQYWLDFFENEKRIKFIEKDVVKNNDKINAIVLYKESLITKKQALILYLNNKVKDFVENNKQNISYLKNEFESKIIRETRDANKLNLKNKLNKKIDKLNLINQNYEIKINNEINNVYEDIDNLKLEIKKITLNLKQEINLETNTEQLVVDYREFIKKDNLNKIKLRESLNKNIKNEKSLKVLVSVL